MLSRLIRLTLFFSIVLPGTLCHSQIPVIFEFSDEPGEGFFDATPLTDPEIPAASTVGEARRLVLEAAGKHLGSFFQPSYDGDEWRIDAVFDPTDPFESGIAAAGPSEFINGSTFDGGTADVFYPPTLVNHLARGTVYEGVVVFADFSSLTDFSFSTVNSPSFDEESLYATAVHELMHGLGFFGDITEEGSYSDSLPTIFDTFLVSGGRSVLEMTDEERAAALVSDDLFFNGPNASAANPLGAGPVKIHAPREWESGSTGSHTDRDAFANVGDLMLPEASTLVLEPINLSDMDVGFMIDIGYTPLVGRCTIGKLVGDFNNNGTVEFADFLTLANNFDMEVETYGQGDADCNGVVEFTDFLNLANNFGRQAPIAASVPEPSGTSLAVGCLIYLLTLVQYTRR